VPLNPLRRRRGFDGRGFDRAQQAAPLRLNLVFRWAWLPMSAACCGVRHVAGSICQACARSAARSCTDRIVCATESLRLAAPLNPLRRRRGFDRAWLRWGAASSAPTAEPRFSMGLGCRCRRRAALSDMLPVQSVRHVPGLQPRSCTDRIVCATESLRLAAPLNPLRRRRGFDGRGFDGAQQAAPLRLNLVFRWGLVADVGGLLRCQTCCRFNLSGMCPVYSPKLHRQELLWGVR